MFGQPNEGRRFRIGRGFATAAIGIVAAFALSTGSASAALPEGNLLINGDAEADFGVTDTSASPTPTGWYEEQDGYQDSEFISTVEYGATGPFPGTDMATQIGGDSNFFAGGPRSDTSDPGTSTSNIVQQVDVSDYAAEIDAGGVPATISGYLGANDNAAMGIAASFTDENGVELNVNNYLFKSSTSTDMTMEKKSQSTTLPVGTRIIWMGVSSAAGFVYDENTGTYIDDDYREGYADNVCLVLSNTADDCSDGSTPPDSDGDGVADVDDDCPDDPGPASNNGCPDGTEDYIQSEVWQAEDGSVGNRMPKVTGKDVDEARDAIIAKFTNASFDLQFYNKCQPTKTLEVIKQIPAAGKQLATTIGEPLLAKLRVCVGDRQFLSDCNVPAINQDLKPLSGEIDGVLGLEISRLADCPIDFDAKITDQFAEDSALDAQGKKRKGQINVAMDCPEESDLVAGIGEGFSGSDQLTFGLRINGDNDELWTLPSPHGGPGPIAYKSFVSITVGDVAGQWPEATAVVDDDQVNPLSKKTDLYKSRDGVITIPVFADRPGQLRICVFHETAGAELLTKSYVIDVIEGPAAGSNEIWKTAGGRYIKFEAGGPDEVEPDEVGKRVLAKRDFFGCLAHLWDCIRNAFNGRSQTINAAEADSGSSSEQKVSTTRKQAGYGIAQISMGPQLQADPGPTAVQMQQCLAIYQNTYYGAKCPVITAPGGAATVGANNGGGAGLVAAGGGNILSHNGGQLVAAGAGNLIGADGSSLIGTDGSSLVGTDGSSLVGTDGSSLVAAGAGNLTGDKVVLMAGGPNAIRPSTADLVAAGGLNLIGTDGSSLVAAGAGNLVGNNGNALVPMNGLG